VTKPLCIDLFCGLGGWTEGFLAEGFDVIGFDVERHVYGDAKYPAQLVLQDVRTIHGSQFRDATMIVASSPCQEFSYRAMPWKRAKALGPPELGMELFAQAGRIQREACEASGRYIPMIQENVRGAQPWVGKAQWHYGSYYLWGDVPALMPVPYRGTKVPGMNWSGSDQPGYKAVAFNDPRHTATKVPSESGRRTDVGKGARFTSRDCGIEREGGVKQGGDWFATPGSISRTTGSKSPARKAAAAKIAKIPFPLARYIAQVARESAERREAA
jgi:hypothetical protein